MAVTTEKAIKLIHDTMLADYKLATRGASRYLTDAMRRAILADAMFYVMLARYETEEEREVHTSPNVYVDAFRTAMKTLEL